MPSPVLMLALVVNGKTLPQPPVARTTDSRGDRPDPAGRQLDRDDAVHPAVVDEQPGDEPLVVPRHPAVLQRGLEQRVQHVEAGLVGGEPGAHLLHAAEGADRDLAVGLPAPRAAPVLELQQLARRLVRRTPRSRPGRPASRCRRRCRRCARRGCRPRRSRRPRRPRRTRCGCASGRPSRRRRRRGPGRSRRWRWRPGARPPPPPTRSTSWSATTASSLTPELLVDQDLAVVVHDLPVDAAVVELLAVALAAAGVGHVLGDEPLQVLGRSPLAVVQVPARRERCVESG